MLNIGRRNLHLTLRDKLKSEFNKNRAAHFRRLPYFKVLCYDANCRQAPRRLSRVPVLCPRLSVNGCQPLRLSRGTMGTIVQTAEVGYRELVCVDRKSVV